MPESDYNQHVNQLHLQQEYVNESYDQKVLEE